MTIKKRYRGILWTAFAALILSTVFFIRPYAVSGGSMEPAYHEGDVLLVEGLTPLLHVWRGEVLVIRNPHDHSVVEIKRLVGLPNEDITLAASSVEVVHQGGGKEVFGSGTDIGLPQTGPFQMHLGPKDYMVLGDNRSKSSDSRTFGAVQSGDIMGRVLLRL